MAKTTPAKGAAALIAATQNKLTFESPGEEALGEIKKVIDYNDGVPKHKRVGQKDVIKMLNDEYGWKHGRTAFMGLIKHHFNRDTWWPER